MQSGFDHIFALSGEPENRWHGSRNTLVYSLTSRPFCLCGFRGSELTTGLPCAKQITKVDVVDVEFSVSKIRGHNYGCAPGGLEDLSWVTVWKLHVGKLVDSFQDSSNLHHMRAWRICGDAARIQPQALLPVCFQRLKYRVRSVQTSPELILFVFPRGLANLASGWIGAAGAWVPVPHKGSIPHLKRFHTPRFYIKVQVPHIKVAHSKGSKGYKVSKCHTWEVPGSMKVPVVQVPKVPHELSTLTRFQVTQGFQRKGSEQWHKGSKPLDKVSTLRFTGST